MNKAKPAIIYTRQPVVNNQVPIPTVKFKHNYSIQSHETSGVKRYLENVKLHHQEDTATARIGHV